MQRRHVAENGAKGCGGISCWLSVVGCQCSAAERLAARPYALGHWELIRFRHSGFVIPLPPFNPRPPKADPTKTDD